MIRTGCACGGRLTALDGSPEAKAEAARRHDATAIHQKWAMARLRDRVVKAPDPAYEGQLIGSAYEEDLG